MANQSTVYMPIGNVVPNTNQNPTLVPNFDIQLSVGDTLSGMNDSMLGAVDLATYLTTYPRAIGTSTITVGGTKTTGDTVNVTITATQLAGGAVTTATYTMVSGDTVESIAAQVADLINNSQGLVNAGIYATANSSDVVTINWPGPLGAFGTVSVTTNVGATETYTLSNSGAFTGGSGTTLCYQNFNYTYNGCTTSYQIGKPVQVSYDVLVAMVRDACPIF